MSLDRLLAKIETLAKPVLGQAEVPPPELIGFCVVTARTLNKWKVNTLAGLAGVSVSTLERVERGERVTTESLEKIGRALGHPPGYFTAPREPLSQDEVKRDFVERYGQLVPVEIHPLNTQRQVRKLANCHAYLPYRPTLDNTYDGDVANLLEWIDLAAFVLGRVSETPDDKGQRRRLYRDVLGCVAEFNRKGIFVSTGVLDAPQPGLPEWKIGVVMFTMRRLDPGVAKRRVILIDKRVTALSNSIGWGDWPEDAG